MPWALVSSDRILNEDKVNNFLQMDYNLSKDLLNIGRFEYHFIIRDAKGASMTALDKGINPPEETTQAVIKINRYVIFKNETANIQFTLWK